MASCLGVRRWLRAAWWLAAALTLGFLPYARSRAAAAGASLHAQACLVAGAFVALALPVSAYEVLTQLTYFQRPRLQVRVVRILAMVPVYAADSWLALRFPVRKQDGWDGRVGFWACVVGGACGRWKKDGVGVQVAPVGAAWAA